MNTQFLASRRAVADRIVERMSHDPAFRQTMMSHPEAALAQAGLLSQLGAPGAEEPEVMRAESTNCGNAWTLLV